MTLLDASALLAFTGDEPAAPDVETLLIAELAGQLRARRYDRRTAPLSLADSIALATAQLERAPLATTDVGLTGAARAENISVIALPNSTAP